MGAPKTIAFFLYFDFSKNPDRKECEKPIIIFSSRKELLIMCDFSHCLDFHDCLSPSDF
eukprot:TRINITY_DN10533_c0_g1_i1.p1 TRINITY_DN10533_c0_g1~~TRINITY_DN10533_c0_g1_i1.p1  ORF type:complete len:59 (+),score=6.21 TRINITY_DN10533_c0_g1_i1:136-312(+)